MQNCKEAVTQVLNANKNIPIGENAISVKGTILHNTFKISENMFYNIVSKELTIYCNITYTIKTIPLDFNSVKLICTIIEEI